jgi:phage anti-repressor protein
MNKQITLKDFLKRYTAISHSFIDEYYRFYELCEINNFGIKLEDVLDYLDIVKRKKFYKRFKEKFTIKRDYQKVRIIGKKVKDVKSVIYYINLDTFEKICMTSKSEKANSVRDYFIILRKFINYYKNHISNMIITSAKKNPNKSIYILLINKNKDILKIGHTSNIRNRLKTYATGKDTHPDIKFIMLVEDPKQVEKCAKIFLEKFSFKKGKEIYKIDIDLMKQITINCAELSNISFTNISKNDNAYIVFEDYYYKEYIDNKNYVYAIEVNPNLYKNNKKSSIKKQSKKSSRKNSRKTK